MHGLLDGSFLFLGICSAGWIISVGLWQLFVGLLKIGDKIDASWFDLCRAAERASELMPLGAEELIVLDNLLSLPNDSLSKPASKSVQPSCDHPWL